MKLKNVFYGFTKNGERKLVWKKVKFEDTTMGDVQRTIYYDLETNKELEINEIDETTLVPIVKLVGDVHRMRRKKVIKVFEADNNLLIDATSAFYGNIVNKTTLSKIFEKDDVLFGYTSKHANKKVHAKREEHVLFARIDDPEGRVMNVKTGTLYPWSEKIDEGISVRETRPINTDKISETIVTKKKMLELDYKKEL